MSNLDEALAVCAKHGVGVDLEALRREVADGVALDEVAANLEAAQKLGIGGVPFYIANGAIGMSGAQDPATFRRFLASAREKRSVTSH